MASGSRVRSSAITSSLTQSVCSASRASCAVSTASAAPRQPAVFGQRRDAQPVQQVQHARAAVGVHPAHRDGGQLGARGDQRLLQHGQVRRTAGTQDQPRAELAARDGQFANQPPCTAVTTSSRAPSDSVRLPPRSRQHRPVDARPRCPSPESRAAPAGRRRWSASSTSTVSSLTVTFIALHQSARPRSAVEFGRDPLGGPRRQQEARAAVARRHQRAVVEPADDAAGCPASSAAGPPRIRRVRTRRARASPRTRRRAVPAHPVTAGAVSRPCSYWVAPTTTPSARGTRYTCRPCTRARITLCGTGIQPGRHRSRSTSPLTGRIGRPGHSAGASMPLAITRTSASTDVARSSTGGAHCTPSRSQCAASASTTRPVVDGQFGLGHEAVPDALRQKRFDVAGGRRRA